MKLSPKDDDNNDGIILQPKKLSGLLRVITTKNHGDFYYRNCFHSFKTKNELQWHKRVCENKDFCNVIMSSEDAKILEFNQFWKSGKAPFIIYVDLECIIEKIEGCKNSSENSSTKKLSEDIPSGFSISTISSFRSIENKHDVYSGKDCIKRFSEFFREHTMKTINSNEEKNEVISKRGSEIMKMQKSVLFVRKIRK